MLSLLYLYRKLIMTKVTDSNHQLHIINIYIDDYNDIFSDFDARKYEERVISEDFLHELKRVSFENELEIDNLNLLIAKGVRDISKEDIIIKKLHLHFKKNQQVYHQNFLFERRKGISMLLLGSILLFFATSILLLQNKQLLVNALIVVLEPAGWFFSWTGLETLFNNTKLKNHNLVFYNKIKKCKVSFINKENS